MIPVRQTRFAIETFGNCFEACIASILELPLASIPDRADFIDVDAWADLVHRTRLAGGDKAVGDLLEPEGNAIAAEALNVWLYERGLAWIVFEGLNKRGTRDHVVPILRGYWIGFVRLRADWRHAVVFEDDRVAWNPLPGDATVTVDDLEEAWILAAADPPMVARKLGPELLPDVAGEIRGLERWGLRPEDLPILTPTRMSDGRIR